MCPICAALAALLPRRGRTGRIALGLIAVLAALLAATYGWVQRHGQAETPFSLGLVGGLGLCVYGLFVLQVLAGFRWLIRVNEGQTGRMGDVPLTWRLSLLWLYRRRDVARMAGEGRLAELMTFSIVVITIVGLSLAVILPHTPAQAEESAVTDLLLTPRSTPGQIEQSTNLQVEDNGDPALSFRLRLPKDWLKFEPYKPETPEGEGLILLSRYGSRDQRAMIEVYAQTLRRELSSADWLAAWLRQNGYTVLKQYTYYSAAGWNADVLAGRRADGKDFLYRMSTYKNGDKLYLVTGYAETAAYANAEEPFVVAAKSFQLLQAADSPSVEPIRTVQISKILPASFGVPEIWVESRDETAGPSQESLNFKNKVGDHTIGQLNVLVAPESAYVSSGDLADTLLAAVKRATGAEVTGMALAPVDLRTDLKEAREGEAEAEVDGAPIKVRLTIGKAGNAWVSFILISSRPNPDLLLVDAINRRAYDIAVRTFGPAW